MDTYAETHLWLNEAENLFPIYFYFALIPNYFKDYRTKVVRKFYKRTQNRVEWGILDMAGDQKYQELHSLFLSSIDLEKVTFRFI